jgi:DNA-binding MarR family transcriptional regulator
MSTVTAKATQKRRDLSGETYWKLYEKVDDNPGLSVYELAKLMNWTPGRVHGSVMRLVEKELMKTERATRGGRSVLLVVPKEWWEFFTPEELEEFKQMEI